MIINFDQFVRTASAPDFNSHFLYNITEQEKNIVKIGMLNLENFHFVQAQKISAERFGINISLPLLKEIVANDIFLSVEVINGALQDTYARDLLSDGIARFCGFKNWPTYSDKVNVTDFTKTLQSLIDSAEAKNNLKSTSSDPTQTPTEQNKPDTDVLNNLVEHNDNNESDKRTTLSSLKQRIFRKH